MTKCRKIHSLDRLQYEIKYLIFNYRYVTNISETQNTAEQIFQNWFRFQAIVLLFFAVTWKTDPRPERDPKEVHLRYN